ncbi:MFS transporter [Thiomicrospira sp. WB1]|uniref:MFS transporter n=1 Tax=Thiomicrospira sp. WB1 TaxID=1685380 RepID=UPI0007488408|nr:MFS transporter [Thiomicrospira sp. WB1]KUJ71103.1 MFS transporter [Thiomicrospira sp. WB1]
MSQPVSDAPRQMSALEKRATLSIAGIFSTRMLGLFMIFPVFALFAEETFVNATGLMTGIAMGIYGLTQAALQIPYGMLSDRFGRKPLIIVGLLVFMLGSVICAMAETIEWMIVGRAVQGMGAVAAVLMASVADLVSERFRLRAMSVVGITIGLSFTLSLVAGPLLSEWFGVRGIFWITALLGLVAIAMVIYSVPPIKQSPFQRETQADPAQFKDVLKNPELLRLDVGVFTLHAILTAMFVAVPLLIRDQAGLGSLHHWELYLPVMLLSFVLMVPFVIQAEAKGRMKPVFVGAVWTLVLMQAAFIFLADGFWTLFVLLLVFFTAFNLLEATLPSLVVKLSPADKKGTASGVYSSSQFLGAALGGGLGGLSYDVYGIDGVFVFTAVVGTLWGLVALTMTDPKPLSIASIPFETSLSETERAQLSQTLLSYDGIYEVVVSQDDQRVYFKIDRKQIDEVGLIDYVERGLKA